MILIDYNSASVTCDGESYFLGIVSSCTYPTVRGKKTKTEIMAKTKKMTLQTLADLLYTGHIPPFSPFQTFITLRPCEFQLQGERLDNRNLCTLAVTQQN